MTYLERFNPNGAFTVEVSHDDLSFAVIRRKVTEQFLSKLGLSGNYAILVLFSAYNWTTLDLFNQNDAFTVEVGHYDLSFAVIRRKVTG